MTKKSMKVGAVCIVSRDRFAPPKERFLFFIFVLSHRRHRRRLRRRHRRLRRHHRHHPARYHHRRRLRHHRHRRRRRHLHHLCGCVELRHRLLLRPQNRRAFIIRLSNGGIGCSCGTGITRLWRPEKACQHAGA